MLNKMKDNSKSGLKIKQLILILPIFVVLAINMQLFYGSKKNNIENNDVQEEIQVAQEVTIEETTQERTIATTTRSSEERTLEQEEENYIAINEIEIAKSMDLTKTSGVSKEDFKILMTNLKVDRSGFFEKNSDIIYDLCKKYELNEIFFCGLIAAESGWNIASNHRNTHNYISMMSKGKLIRYSSDEEGLEAAAKLLHNNYLTKGGSCYSGKTLANVQKRFCPNSSTWVNLVYGCMKQIVN